MDNEKVREQFKRAIKYKGIGFIIILIAIIPMMMIVGTMKYITTIIILGIGVLNVSISVPLVEMYLTLE